MASLGDVPEDVIVEILLRLPVESLVRFKCVCKCWYDVIKNPKFVAKHLVNSVLQQQQRNNNVPNSSSSATLLVKRYFFLEDSGRSKETILSFLPGDESESESVVDIDLPFFEKSVSVTICGHSHGMVCLSDRRTIVLCNPATREFRQLPPSILVDKHSVCYTNRVGFGYDPKSKDFKVVRVVNFAEPPRYFENHLRVEVYDLSRDAWRVIDTRVCGHVCYYPSFQMYYKGMYYWWAERKLEEGLGENIQLFDMSEEVFSLIPVPESLSTGHDYGRSMGVWNGSIVLFIYPSVVDAKTFNLWVMEKKESSGVSWSKALTMGPVSGIEKPLLFVNSDQLLLMEAKESQIVSYNINTREFKNLPLKGERHFFQATVFTKSLMSVKGGRGGNKQQLDLKLPASQILFFSLV